MTPKYNGLCTKEDAGNVKYFKDLEDYGPHSRCFELETSTSNQFEGGCLRSRCEAGHVEMLFGEEIFTCPNPAVDETVQVNTKAYTGRIQCPSYQEMCGELLSKRCPMDCYGNGLCMGDGTCQCFAGYSGKECNTCPDCVDETRPFVTGFNSGKEPAPEDPEEPEKPSDDDEEEPEEPEEPERPSEDDEEEKPEEPQDPQEVELEQNLYAIYVKLSQLKKNINITTLMEEYWSKRVTEHPSNDQFKENQAKFTSKRSKLSSELQTWSSQTPNLEQQLETLQSDSERASRKIWLTQLFSL